MKGYTRSEYACKCGCGFDTVDYELDMVMDDIRQHFNQRVFINRGCSCVKHNDAIQLEYNPHYVAGTSDSQHIYAKACDFRVENVHEDEVVKYLDYKYPDKYGIGRYNGRTHIDVKSGYARRWDKRKTYVNERL